MIIEIIGIMGSIILSSCTLPQTIKSIYQGHSNGLSFWSLLMALLGAIFLLTFMVATSVPFLVMINLTVLIISMAIQLKYLIFPRSKE